MVNCGGDIADIGGGKRSDIRWSGGDREMGKGDAVEIEFCRVGKIYEGQREDGKLG